MTVCFFPQRKNMSIPTVQLSTGAVIPLLGLGTWKSAPGQVQQAVEVAIDNGYRHIDCAHAYRNEKEVGAGISSRIQKGVVKREDLFIVSKLWNNYHDQENVKPAFMESLTNLHLTYLDVYLMHSPMGTKLNKQSGEVEFSDVDYTDTWKEMEKLVDEGLVKAIGVSNFNVGQLERLQSMCRINPAVNQVELHPYLTQPKLVQYCKTNGIVLTAYSPFGSPDSPFVQCDKQRLLEDPVISAIGKKYGKTNAHVLLLYHVQRGVTVIPKSVTPVRIIQNAQIFDFSLSDDDIKTLEGLNRNWRSAKWDVSGLPSHKFYPFKED
ncbi:aldo-keto reductase family 1 member B1-like [Protopterus annectens]|uniref:aldo-keto reductase family 1 member B1-like n=1 Tax=Protopterus annectens TaxID=7888 RepID=UPI001CFB3892|nr:aldo-keto reductase family 1 member B1-like [Protopterus annectens]